jgi:hypothetical protein
MLGLASGGFRRRTCYREDIRRVRRRFRGAKQCSEVFVRIQGVGRRPGRTGRRPRSALRWIWSLSCAGTLSMDSYGLILVCIVLDDALCQDIEGLSHQNVICWAVNDMDLEIQGNVSNSTRNVASKS